MALVAIRRTDNRKLFNGFKYIGGGKMADNWCEAADVLHPAVYRIKDEAIAAQADLARLQIATVLVPVTIGS